jgi:single-strand DNA-binding protein
MGNLVSDAETRYTQSAQPVTSFRIACNERYFSGGEQRERVEYVNCVIWGKRGEALSKAECLSKGQGLFVEGRLQTRSYEVEGVKKFVTEVVIGTKDSDLQLLGRRGSQMKSSPVQDAPAPRDADSQPEDFSD